MIILQEDIAVKMVTSVSGRNSVESVYQKSPSSPEISFSEGKQLRLLIFYPVKTTTILTYMSGNFLVRLKLLLL